VISGPPDLEECPERLRLILEYADASAAYVEAIGLHGAQDSHTSLLAVQVAWRTLETHVACHGCGPVLAKG
jgi:hypothetical protein